jgi:1-acyl-sn-glycerol-3-phosphate acyltransferase
MIKHLAAALIGVSVAGFARALTGVLPNWRGCLPESRQRVYFANHASHGDFVLIWTVLPHALRRATRPVAAADYWGGGLRGFIGREVFNAVLVDRSGATSEPISVIMAAMERGASLIIFPEGTRNTGEQPLLPFKSGLYRMAQARPDIEFVPVWIDNIRRVMPKGEFLPVPLLCSVTFGTPIAVQLGQDKETFLATAREAMLALRPGRSAA